MKKNQRIYIVKKYVVATDAEDALKKEKNVKPHDVFLEQDSTKMVIEETMSDIKKQNPIGF